MARMDRSELEDHEPGGRRVPAKLVLAAIVAVLALIFVLQNGEQVQVSFLGWDGTVGLWIVIVASMAAGIVIGYLLRFLRARRRD